MREAVIRPGPVCVLQMQTALTPGFIGRYVWIFLALVIAVMNINIVCVGNLKEPYLKSAAAEYTKRLSRFCRLTVTETPESRPDKEKTALLRACRGIKIALCIEGERMSSQALADRIKEYGLHSSSITFIIGGSEGLDPEVKSAADLRLSFSDMTFPHQLMRVILLEQIYRAFTINNNIKYHK